jgi:hypothetical protein
MFPSNPQSLKVLDFLIKNLFASMANAPPMSFPSKSKSPVIGTEPSAKKSPDPDGVAQVPSPLQKVEDEAEVPLLRFVTGKFPVTAVANGILVKVFDDPDMDLFPKVSTLFNVASLQVLELLL